MEITFDGGKVITAHTHGHIIRTDQPLDNGGGNTAAAPFDLFLASSEPVQESMLNHSVITVRSPQMISRSSKKPSTTRKRVCR
jgi:hypothetical protein